MSRKKKRVNRATMAWLRGLQLLAGGASSILGVVLTRRAFLPESWPF